MFLFLYEYFRHEIACGYYRVSSYFISKVFCDLVPMRLFPLLIFSSITYFMVGKQLFLKHEEEYKVNFVYKIFEKNKLNCSCFSLAETLFTILLHIYFFKCLVKRNSHLVVPSTDFMLSRNKQNFQKKLSLVSNKCNHFWY